MRFIAITAAMILAGICNLWACCEAVAQYYLYESAGWGLTGSPEPLAPARTHMRVAGRSSRTGPYALRVPINIAKNLTVKMVFRDSFSGTARKMARMRRLACYEPVS
jgi:hypothetical protein